MTAVVAVEKAGTLVFASDSLTVFGDVQTLPPELAEARKVRRVGEAIVGASGWGVYDGILTDYLGDGAVPDLSTAPSIFKFFTRFWKALHEQYAFVNDQPQAKDTPFGDLDSTFLIGHGTSIFKVSSDMDVTPLSRFFAIGSGSEYALGAIDVLYDNPAMDARAIAVRAVEAAIRYDAYCGGPVRVETIGAGG